MSDNPKKGHKKEVVIYQKTCLRETKSQHFALGLAVSEKLSTTQAKKVMLASFRTKLSAFWSKNQTSLSSIIGVVAGLLVGLATKAFFWGEAGQEVDPNLLRYLSLPSLLFIRAFLILIIPLLIASLSTSMMMMFLIII